MNGVEISEPHNLFRVLERAYESSYNRSDGKLIFSDGSPLDSMQTVSSEVILSGMVYTMSILLSSEEGIIDFSSYIPYFERRLSTEKPDLELLCLREGLARVKRRVDDFWIYGVENGRDEGGSFLRVFCGGGEGLFPRNLAKKGEFVETIEEITYFANLFFEPFVVRRKNDITHYLTLTRE